MTHSPRILLILVGWLLAAGVPSAALAATVYQVEMIVFERTSAADEQWPQNLELRYPQRWQRLFDPSNQTATADDGFMQTLAAERGERPAAAGAPAGQYFTFRAPAQRTLQKAREALDRSRELRVLFHQAWLQPLGNIEQAPALILHGGNSYGSFYELQGYITLGTSRYVHLETNLWLTHFAPNRGQPSTHWPELPREPAGRGATGAGADEARWDETGNDNSAAPYIIERIVTLQQKRRMRSGELHYVDHPKLGILLKFFPL